MPIVSPTPITPLATDLPDPADRNTYGARGRLVWAWEVGALVPGANAIADASFENASHAQDMAEIAQAASNFAGDWSTLTGALNKPASVFHSGSYWVLVNNLANVTTSTPGVSADWRELTISASAVTVIYDNATSGRAATDVQAAIDEVSADVAAVIGRNNLINPKFNVNNLAVSGTVVLAAGIYGHDGWKAGAGGCTYTFATSAGVTTLTISAGTLVQTMEGAFLRSGTHVLSWAGTAQGRIAGGSYGASGITGSVTGGTNTEVEFNTGTLALPQFARGSKVRPFEDRPLPLERTICNRYCCVLYWGHTVGNATGAQSFGSSVSWPTLMYATPTVTDLGGGTVVNASTVTIDTVTAEGARIFLGTTGAGAATVHNRRIRAVARL